MQTTEIQSGRLNNQTNKKYISRIEKSIQQLLLQILQEGCYGKGCLEITVQDGIVQTLRRIVEQTDK